MLPLELQATWDDYLAADASGHRRAALAALDRFIDALLHTDPVAWRRWAYTLAERVSTGASIPVMHPLFCQVLLPALAEGVLERRPGYARSLAFFDQMLVRTRPSPLPEGLDTAEGLLEEALRVDPHDDLARRRLLARRETYLRYTLHEIPAGVLYGQDGATTAQCNDLLELLADVDEHRTALRENEPSELLEACAFHYPTYREWLTLGRPAGSYAAYLMHLGAPPSRFAPPH